jgi:iron complex outermembrane receptor protein
MTKTLFQAVAASIRCVSIGSVLVLGLRLTCSTVIFAQQPARLDAERPQPPAASVTLAEEDASKGDDFDSLLKFAEQDVAKLTEVKVSRSASTGALNAEVSTVSRTSSTVGKSPAAVFVITNEMIRRSGAMSIPEVLRMAPGVNVARINANQWAVSIRGFNGQYANKLLVQIDGRSIYTPVFAGVIWPAQDVLLEDVERIEVIRGPGASVWGANAVNGIINIITKSAGETQGVFAQTGGGTFERAFVNARYGGQIGTDIDYRVYGKWFERGTGVPTSGEPFDDWRAGRGGFRLDWDPGRTGVDHFTLQGDAYSSTAGLRELLPATTFPFSNLATTDQLYRGNNVLARWTHVIDEESDWQFQAYYDFAEIDDSQRYAFVDQRHTIDFDFQDRFPLGEAHKIVWGAGYRLTLDRDIAAGFPIGFTDPRQSVNIVSCFLQDEIHLVPDRWSVTFGCKFLHHTYTNFEYQPTARLLHTPDDRQSLWASVSRAVRIPSRADETLILNTPPPFPAPVFPQLRGNDQLVSEELLAWECGYRAQTTDQFSWDLAVFFNQYENLIGIQPPGPPEAAPFGLVLPLNFANLNRAQSYGFELASNVELTEDWSLRGAYSFLQVEFLGVADEAEGLAPTNQFYLQSSHNLANNVELDLIGRYVDSLAVGQIPSYFVGDVRLAWHCRPDVELFVVGRGLFDDGHREISTQFTTTTTGVRSEVYGGITIRR